jgi:hypothetical protein
MTNKNRRRSGSGPDPRRFDDDDYIDNGNSDVSKCWITSWTAMVSILRRGRDGVIATMYRLL